MKQLLAALDLRPSGGRALAVLPAEVHQAITGASGLDWLPVSLNLTMTQAIYEGLGEAEADRFFRAHTLASFEGPLLQTMVSSGVRILGLDPASFGRWVPKGWHLLFRGVGEWTVVPPSPGVAVVSLTLAQLPQPCADHPVWLRSVARSLDALLDLAQVRGSADLLPRDRGSGQATFELRWQPRGGAPAAPPKG
jgi:hypothetical protein